MLNPLPIRTFVYLAPKELKFLHDLQQLVQERTGKKRRPPLQGIIRGVILDYKHLLEMASDPDFLEAYETAKSTRLKKVLV
jgi:hypothetical protein